MYTTCKAVLILSVLAAIVELSTAFNGRAPWMLRAFSRRAISQITCQVEPANRRRVLLASISGLVGSELATASSRFPLSPLKLSAMSSGSKDAPLRVCVVGAGSISREFALYHFGPATQTEVASIVDLNEERASQLASDVGSVQAGASVVNRGTAYRAAAATQRGKPVPFGTSLAPHLGDCDVVYVGTTPNSHAELVLEALAAGKSILLEKPLAARGEDADAIVEAAEQRAARGQVVAMDIGMRWNPALEELRRSAVEEGELGALRRGRLTLAFAQWPREWQVQPWVAGKAEGGPLREVGTHFFFALMELFGEGCVDRVRVEVEDGERPGAAEVAATGVLQLGAAAGRMEGLEIALDVRTNSTAGDVYELEVEGEAGRLLLVDFCRLRQTRPEERWVVPKGSYGRVESVATLVEAVRAGGGAEEARRRRVITAREGRNAQRLLDAVLASRGRWVQVRYD